jgi:hypothetical protein
MIISHILQCPICQGTLHQEVGNHLHVPRGMHNTCRVFICYSPLANLPLHYYSHVVSTADSNEIIFQEFSVDLDNRWIIFSNYYVLETSSIKFSKDGDPLIISVILFPDFPKLESLKSKIRLSITFS